MAKISYVNKIMFKIGDLFNIKTYDQDFGKIFGLEKNTTITVCFVKYNKKSSKYYVLSTNLFVDIPFRSETDYYFEKL